MTTTTPPGHRRWLFLDGSTQFGGHEVMLLRLLEELEQQGQVASRVLSRAGTMLQAKTTRYTTASALPRVPSSRTGWGRLVHGIREARVCFDVVRSVDPELCVVVDGCLLAQPFLTALCWLTGRRLAIYVPIAEPTESLGFRTGRLRDWLVRHGFGNLPDAWITLTAEQAVSFAKWAGVARPIFLLPNTVAQRIEALSAEQTTSVNVREREAQRILVLGRLDAHQKGLDLLLEYLARAPGNAMRFTITIAGHGPAREMIANAVAGSASLARTVRLASWSDPVDLLRAHDVLLLPSRFEGVPLVMLEAMALGVPVVASDLPGTRQFLAPECLFPVGNFALAFELAARLRDAATCSAVVRRNQATFAAQASGVAFASAVTKLTRELSAVGSKVPPNATSVHA